MTLYSNIKEGFRKVLGIGTLCTLVTALLSSCTYEIKSRPLIKELGGLPVKIEQLENNRKWNLEKYGLFITIQEEDKTQQLYIYSYNIEDREKLEEIVKEIKKCSNSTVDFYLSPFMGGVGKLNEIKLVCGEDSTKVKEYELKGSILKIIKGGKK